MQEITIKNFSLNQNTCFSVLFSRNFSNTEKIISTHKYKMTELYVDIAFPLDVDKLFTYRVPGELHGVVKRGIRVAAPFGKHTATGIIVNIKNTSSIKDLKSIYDVLDLEPLISDDLLNLTNWIAEYYFTPVGGVLRAVVIHGALRQSKRQVSLNTLQTNPTSEIQTLRPKHLEIIKILQKRKSISISQLQKLIGSKSVYALLGGLAEKEIILITEQPAKSILKVKFEPIIEVDDSSREKWKEWLSKLEKSVSSKRFIMQISVITKLLQLEQGTKFVSLKEFIKKVGVPPSTIKTLANKQLINIGKREILRTPEYDLYESLLGTTKVTLNSNQQQALEAIIEAINQNNYHTFLLYGVTGSGKTQVYIEAIKEVLNRGKTAIVLVPEISLTPQTVRRFKFYFGKQISVMHSRMSPGERYDAWRMAQGGTSAVVIGPRSAIFAPLKNLGLIVVDEEQESSYKQFDQAPRYHARDVAIVRASNCNAVVVLGSATPSLESYSNSMSGKYTLLELPKRADNAKLPEIQIIDMTQERTKKLEIHREQRREEYKKDPVQAKLQKRKFEFNSISDILREKIEDRLKKNEGIILLQNRRGFSPFIECPNCGYVEICENCNISLTYHLAKEQLRCHYCGIVKQVPIFCPNCQSLDIQYRGFGTQRVEEELAKLFPMAKLLRMDLDTTTAKGAHDQLLRQFSEGGADILLGTQMVAKGLDFSRVTLVGVISADIQMLLPDFRSSERTFQLLTQVAGRAGRSALAGEVIIQTFQPRHPSLQHVITHNFTGFYSEEIVDRRELNYPPFSRLILIEFKGKNGNEVIEQAQNFRGLLKKQNPHFLVLGPAAAALARLKGLFRWHIILKSLKAKDPSGKIVHGVLQEAVDVYRKSPGGKSKSVKIIIDVDPVGMM